VFVVMCRRWADYDPHRPLRPWLLGIAFRVARDHRKRPSRELAGGLIDPPDEAGDPERQLAAARARALVREALAALSEKQRVVMILHDLDGVTMHEIAGTLAAPMTTLYSRLYSARRSFERAVRRLERRYVLVPASIEALLQIERAPDPLPAATRLRLLARTRATAVRTVPAPSQPAASVRPHGSAASRSWSGNAAPRSLFARTLEVTLGVLLVGASALLISERPSADARAAIHQEPVAAAPARAPRVRPPRLAAPSAVLAAAIAPPAPPSLAQGLVGYWRFDESPAGGAARDLSGHATDCLPRGTRVEWTAGRFGGAVNLTGHGWLECPDPRFGGAPDLTVAAFIKRPRAQTGMRVIATRQLGSGARDHFFFGLQGEALTVASHVWNGPLRHPLPPAGERWVHVAAVHRDGQVTLYVDGAPVASRRSYRGRIVRASSPILIGAGANGPDPAVTTQHFAGAIDELAVYDRPLYADEIAALAAGQQPPLSR
jgi:RNA polymerase sigma-70 factor (ECF subfamily)